MYGTVTLGTALHRTNHSKLSTNTINMNVKQLLKFANTRHYMEALRLAAGALLLWLHSSSSNIFTRDLNRKEQTRASNVYAAHIEEL